MERRSPNTRMGKMPVAKIPALRSPMAKSPMPKSPVPMSPVAYKSRCAYGLFSFLRFGHRRSKKMISDTHNNSFDDQSRNSLQYNQNKRNTSIEQQTKEIFTRAKVENVQSNHEHAQDQSSKSTKAAKTSRRPRRIPSSTTNRLSESNEVNLQVNLNEATEAFINRELIDGSSHESRQLLDALEVLNSNKDLFAKLLQNPNSLFKDMRDCKDKEQQKPLQKENQLLENIVIMKPGLNISRHCTDESSPQSQNIQQTVKPERFHFEQMKRKLMQAIRMRRKKQRLRNGSAMSLRSKKGNVEDMVSRNSPEKDDSVVRDSSPYFVNAKREEIQMDKTKESDWGHIDGTGLDSEGGLGSSCLSPRRHPKMKKHELYVDPSIDISELTNGNKRPLRNDSGSPQRRFPAYGFLHIVSENDSRSQKGKKGSYSSPRQIVEASPCEKKPDVSGPCNLDFSENKSISSSNISFGEIGTTVNEDLGKISSSRMASKLDSSNDNGENRSNKMVDKSEDRPALPSKDYSLSGLNHRSGEQFDVAKDNTEQPSQFVFMLNYIGRVIEASNFTWDELSWKYQSSDQIFDGFEDIDVGPTQCFQDRRLIIDYVNEVALDAYGCYSRGSPWSSFIRPSIVPAISTDGNMTHELMKYVDWELLSAQNSGSLEKIMFKDLEKSRWMDIRIDAEDTVSEVVDYIIEELMTEVAIQ